MIFHDEEGVHMSEADYAELVKREIGPCGKHPKMFWVEASAIPAIEQIGRDGPPDIEDGYCKACREIEQAVAGAYEAAALACESLPETIYGNKTGRYDCSKAIRSLDSSAARLGKQAIREEALREAGKHAPWSDGKCTCGVIYTTVTSDTPFEDWEQHILELIDKPGGK